MTRYAWLIATLPLLAAVDDCAPAESSTRKEQGAVERQQDLYLTAQPVPTYDYSLERDRVIGLYNARLNAAQTWSVWRSQTGVIEGDCPSSGYPIPYGVSLTASQQVKYGSVSAQGMVTVDQAEPNGLYVNGVTTVATWVFCVVDGAITPVYVESNVTVYPYPITVDYDKGRIVRDGAASVTLTK